MKELEIRRSAAALIKKYGERADQAAIDRLDAALMKGDMRAYDDWRRIAKMAAEINRSLAPANL